MLEEMIFWGSSGHTLNFFLPKLQQPGGSWQLHPARRALLPLLALPGLVFPSLAEFPRGFGRKIPTFRQCCDPQIHSHKHLCWWVRGWGRTRRFPLWKEFFIALGKAGKFYGSLLVLHAGGSWISQWQSASWIKSCNPHSWIQQGAADET